MVMYTMIQERNKSEERQEDTSVRASISFPSELYRTLEGIAKKKKVSLAWVVRDAAEKYVAEQWPLFREQK
jgi:metal-responsive CopG/Arc/MetJ family transcriptional regulator